MLLIRHPPTSIFFPYTTLFRSILEAAMRKISIEIANGPCVPVVLLRDGASSTAMPALWLRARSNDPSQRDQVTGQRLVNPRSEEHTSELQSLTNLVCRLLLEKK